jgi:hypothetical protein
MERARENRSLPVLIKITSNQIKKMMIMRAHNLKNHKII